MNEPRFTAEHPARIGELRFFITDDEAWLAQVAALNHLTFAQEIPQHQPRADGLLYDSLLERSTCLVCVDAEDKLAGMISVNGERPFSLDRKLEDLDSYLPAGCTPCEFRLLAIDRKRRGSAILAGLIALMVDHSIAMGFDLGLISGTTRQLKLYKHIGFAPFAQPVGSEDALYQPMLLTWDRVAPSLLEFRTRMLSE